MTDIDELVRRATEQTLSLTLEDIRALADTIESLQARVKELEAQLAAMNLVGDMSPDQNWKGISGAVAFHLIERHCDGWADVGDHMDKWREANTAPAAARGEPVAEWNVKEDGHWELHPRRDILRENYRVTLPAGTYKLFTHPAPAVPDGWQMVPKEPTKKMNTAGYSKNLELGGAKRAPEETYKAMLAAAPKEPT